MSQAYLMSNLDEHFSWGVFNAMYLKCAWAILDGSLLILVALYIFISFIKWPICLIFFTDDFFLSLSLWKQKEREASSAPNIFYLFSNRRMTKKSTTFVCLLFVVLNEKKFENAKFKRIDNKYVVVTFPKTNELNFLRIFSATFKMYGIVSTEVELETTIFILPFCIELYTNYADWPGS